MVVGNEVNEGGVLGKRIGDGFDINLPPGPKRVVREPPGQVLLEFPDLPADDPDPLENFRRSPRLVDLEPAVKPGEFGRSPPPMFREGRFRGEEAPKESL